MEIGRVPKRLTHGFANISTEQRNAVTVLCVHELDDVLSLFSTRIVEVKVDDLDDSLGIVDRRPNSDADDVAHELVKWPSRFS